MVKELTPSPKTHRKSCLGSQSKGSRILVTSIHFYTICIFTVFFRRTMDSPPAAERASSESTSSSIPGPARPPPRSLPRKPAAASALSAPSTMPSSPPTPPEPVSPGKKLSDDEESSHYSSSTDEGKPSNQTSKLYATETGLSESSSSEDEPMKKGGLNRAPMTRDVKILIAFFTLVNFVLVRFSCVITVVLAFAS